MTTIEGAGLTKCYGGRDVFRNINFSISAGKFLILRGDNGSGKTTLLRCLIGTERLDEGSIMLDGKRHRPSELPYWSQVYGVLDDFSWFPDLTIGDHFKLHEADTDPTKALAQFGIADLSDRLAVSLSSGQLRRAALATTLVRSWTVLLLDEPEQRLDDQGLTRLSTVLRQFQAAGKTVILSTHSPALQSSIDGQVLTLGL